MSPLLLYNTLVLQRLIPLLQEEGIVITTATAIDIEKVMAKAPLQEGESLAGLKYLLSPLLCRNKEDQEIVHKVFDKLDGVLEKEYQPVVPVPVVVIDDSVVKKVVPKRKRSLRFWLFWGVGGVIALAAVVLPFYFFWWMSKPERVSLIKIVNTNEKLPLVKGDTVNLVATLDKSVDTSDVQVDWRLDDKIIDNQLSVGLILANEGSLAATAYLKNAAGDIIDSSGAVWAVDCEPQPSVAIAEGNLASGRNKQYTAQFTNPSPQKEKYAYKWIVDDSLKSTDSVFRYAKSYNKIQLVVGCKGLHCSTDSMTAQLYSVPAVKATVRGEGEFKVHHTANWRNILISAMILLLVPVGFGWLAFIIIRRVKNRLPKVEPLEPGSEGPYAIEFPDQQHVINTEQDISKLADILRKRQVSEACKLNLRKTIRSTIVSGGIPTLEYTPLSKPLSYLVFIDREKPDSHLTRLFQYLLQKMHKEDVKVYVYEYFKEPLFLSNEKLNHYRIPLEKMSALYPDTTLFIFGDARYFLYPLKGTLKPWVARKLDAWPMRFLITPWVKVDWDSKEKKLIDSRFVVLPADLSALPVLDKILSRQIDIPAQKKETIETDYRSRLLNFNEFEVVQEYLGDELLMQWVCSLAVYPSLDWNLTLAMGKAIEQQAQDAGQQISLVNYTNLLKLGRISWMQEGMMPESLRVQMLNWLPAEAESLARQVLSNQLQSIEATIPDNSIVKHRFDIHKKLNDWLLKTHAGTRTAKEDDAFIYKLIGNDQLDEGQAIYLAKGRGTMLPHPLKKEDTVCINEYFTLQFKRNRLVALGLALAIGIVAATIGFVTLKKSTNYLSWFSAPPVKLNVVVTGDIERVGSLAIQAGNTRSESSPVRSSNDSLWYDMEVTPEWKEQVVSYALSNLKDDEQVIVSDSFMVNAGTYYIDLKETPRTPLAIYYRDASALALANTLVENLPAQFNAGLRYLGFDDTTTAQVYYTDSAHLQDAQLAAATVNSLLNINIRPQLDQSRSTDDPTKVHIYLNPRPGCTNLAVSALPASLNEIWQGGTSNRMVQIDLANRVLYYSTGNVNNYGTYSIDDICFSAKGVYRIITRTQQGYKLFFIRNVQSQSFELSVCQDFAKTKEELQQKEETYCNKFNTMQWYYPQTAQLIYLPMSGTALVPAQQKKLALKIDSISGNSSMPQRVGTYRAFYTSYDRNDNWARIRKILTDNNYPVSRASVPINLLNAYQKFQPFRRNTIKVTLEMEAPAKGNDIPNNPVQSKDSQSIQADNPMPNVNTAADLAELKKKGAIDLGYFYTKGDGAFQSGSSITLERIAQELISNRKASLIIQLYYLNDTERKRGAANIELISKQFEKLGVKNAPKRIGQLLTPQNSVVQKVKDPVDYQYIYGVNFSPTFNNPAKR